MSLQTPKSTKFIIRHQNIKQISTPINIFTVPQPQPCKQLAPAHSETKEFNVVGDLEFKRRYCQRGRDGRGRDGRSQGEETGKDGFWKLEDTNVQTMYGERTKTEGDCMAMTLGFAKDGFNQNRQKRALKRYQMLKQTQKQLNNFLRKQSNRHKTEYSTNTLTYNSKQIQITPNPQLINLINDNIPEYWQKTLRDNDKRLKQHVRGNPYQKLIQEEMFQTVKGRQRLTMSIPKIKREFLENGGRKRGMMDTIYSVGHRPKILNQSIRFMSNKTSVEIPKLYCEQVLKIHSTPAYRY